METETSQPETDASVPASAEGADDGAAQTPSDSQTPAAQQKDSQGRFIKADAPKKEPAEGEDDSPKEPQRFKRTLRIKGEDIEHEASEDELWSAYRRQAASQRSLGEAAQAKKEAETLQKVASEQIQQAQLVFQAMREPSTAVAALSYMGINPYQFAAAIMGGPPQDPGQYQMWESQMQQMYMRMKEMDEQNTTVVSAEQQQRQQAELTYHLDTMGRTFEATMKKYDLPRTDWTLALMAAAYKEGADNNYELTEDEVMGYVLDTVKEQQQMLVSRMSGEQILKNFPELARKVYEAGLARWKSKNPQRQVQQQQAAAPPPANNGQKRLMSDKEIDRLLGIS
jgi:hypothetical protein